MAGDFLFTDSRRRILFVPDAPFAAGEEVSVALARDIAGRDGSHLGPAGHAFRYWSPVALSSTLFTEYSTLSNDSTAFQTDVFTLVAGDLDDDGSPDLLTVNEGTRDVRTFLNLGDGSGEYGPRQDTAVADIYLKYTAVADFSGDGLLDLCAADDPFTTGVRAFHGLGDGGFVHVQDVPIGGLGIAAVDVDGDADLDVAACGPDMVNLLLNDGSGSFTLGTPVEGGLSFEFLVEGGDLDLDGIMDLVLVSHATEDIRTSLGSGDGTFIPAGLVPQRTGGRTVALDLGDLDGDGDVDVAVANQSQGTAGILRNLGSGTFSSVSILHPGGDPYSSTLGDLDGDGDLDWLVSVTGHYWRAYGNGGNAAFTPLADLYPGAAASAATMLDADGDGDLDLALAEREAEEIRLIRND